MALGKLAFLTTAICFSGNVYAATYKLTADGTVSYVGAFQNGASVATPAGQVGIGDTFRLEATFDLDQAQLSALYDADPTVNVYHLPDVRVTATIGNYSTTFTPLFNFNASVQLWNDRDVVGPTDAQSFEFFNYQFVPNGGYAFNLGSGPISELFTFNAFDFTATARTNDLISQFAPYSAFASKSLSYGLMNADTNLFVSVQTSLTSAAVVAVPEPGVWAMMLTGLGSVGLAARRRRNAGATARGDMAISSRDHPLPAR